MATSMEVILIALIILLPVVGIGFLVKYLRQILTTNKQIATVQRRHYTLLRILVPKQNSKSPLAAEQMFAALHGIYQKGELEQEHFSFEISATTQSINFYMLVPTHLRDFIEGQIYSQYPHVEIDAAPDYSNVDIENKSLVGTEMSLAKTDYYPIRTFVNFDVDPLAGITGVLSKINEGELLSIQAVLSPIDDSWQKEGLDYVKKIKEGKSVAPPPPLYVEFGRQGSTLIKEVARGVVTGIVASGGETKAEDKKEVKLSGPEEVALKGIESKVIKLGYAATIRVLAITENEELSKIRVQSILGAFKQFNLTNLNGFEEGNITSDPAFLRTYRSRRLGLNPFRLNVEEIASLYHFPDLSVATPNIVWAGSKKGEPPQNLPIEEEVPSRELTTFGLTSFRNRRTKFGIKADDRRLHFYAIGKTGTGKSTLIENMIYDDIKEGRGVAVVDPHGELIEHILRFIPDERINEVVYFNPDDREFPLAFNLLESVSSDMRSVVASGLMSIFTKLWANVWSARMEYILRNSILAALEIPNATLLSIMRLLNDSAYRKFAYEHITDPVVKDFFINEYDKYDAKFRQEAIAPIQNKVGQFLSSSTIRNIVGQPKSTFNLTDIMDSGKIFLVDLSIGRIGEDNSKLLGSMMITKIQLAAMGRAKISSDLRKDFYLYVDEFQNFATDSFAVILSEARKYRLNLVLVNQYIAQIPELVADAIFGNVGSMIAFRVGATDADKLVKEFEPVFDATDMINLPNRQIYVKMAIDGVTSQAFSAHTLPPKGIVNENAQRIIEWSRQTYARDRAEVEKEISDTAQADIRPVAEKQYDEMRQQPYVVNGTLYKEFSGRGGQRWYFGQPEEVLTPEERDTVRSSQPIQKEIPPAPENINVAQPAEEKKENKPTTELALPTTKTDIITVAADHPSLPSSDSAESNLTPSQRRRRRKKRQRENNPAITVDQYTPATQPSENFAVPKPLQSSVEAENRGESSKSDLAPSSDTTTLPSQGSVDEQHEKIIEEIETMVQPNNQNRGDDGAEERGKDSATTEIVPKRMVNRGHQHDDWLPLDEL